MMALLGIGIEIMDHGLKQFEVRGQGTGGHFLEHETDGMQDRRQRLVFFTNDMECFHGCSLCRS